MSASSFTIVMGLLTAIPFGLAVRDTINHDDPAHRRAREQVETERLLQLEAERLRQIDEAARDRETELRELVGELHGEAPATLGSLFGGLRLEAMNHDDLPDRADLEITEATRGRIVVAPDDLDREAYCRELRTELQRAWGAPHYREDNQIWLSRDLTQRATLDHRGCTLVFERTVLVQQWLDATVDSVVPMWAMGQPAVKLVEQLEKPPKIEGDEIRWWGPGLGFGEDPTELVAYTRAGLVVGLRAVVTTDETTGKQVYEQQKKLGREDMVLVTDAEDERWDVQLLLRVGSAAGR